jgi:zinc and cadmium transporter
MLLFWILGASIAETLVALIGQLAVFVWSSRVKEYIQYFISFAVGTLLAVVFLDLLPEALEETASSVVFAYVLIGFLFFFLLTRVLFWYHCHTTGCPVHQGYKRTGAKVLLGDAVHNFIDGIIIALAFFADFKLGVVTSVAVLVHEAPMEMSDFFILINSGYSKEKALFYNFLIALTTPIGALITYFSAYNLNALIGPALGLVAGNFLYIAAVDLVPELHDHKEARTKINTVLQFSLIILGILAIYASGLMFGE